MLLTALTASAAFTALEIIITRQRIRMARFEMDGLKGAIEAVYSFPPGRTEGHGDAQRATDRLNLMRRAQFVVTAARRIAAALRLARSRGELLGSALASAVSLEKRYYGQHLQAIIQRMQAASRADAAADKYGDLLGWYTIRDSRTSAECLAADGKNFRVTSMPLIGFPGAVHPGCRCYPGPPHTGARILPSARMAVVA